MRNPFGGWVDNTQAGADFINQATDRTRAMRAGYQAAPRIAQGDYAGAAQAYAGQGMADQTASLMADQANADTQAYNRQRQGQQDQRLADQDQRKAQMAAAEGLMRGYALLARLATPEARFAEFQRNPLFAQLIPDESVRSQLNSPDAFSDEHMAMFREELKRQMVNLGGGGVAEYDPNAATPEQRFTVLRQPDPKAIAAGSTVYGPDGPVYTAPKQWAPKSGGGGRGGAAKRSAQDMSPEELIAIATSGGR